MILLLVMDIVFIALKKYPNRIKIDEVTNKTDPQN